MSTPKQGKPYVVMWSVNRCLTGFLGGESVTREFDDRTEAVTFYREAQEKFKGENPNNFQMVPTFYKRDQDVAL